MGKWPTKTNGEYTGEVKTMTSDGKPYMYVRIGDRALFAAGFKVGDGWRLSCANGRITIERKK